VRIVHAVTRREELSSINRTRTLGVLLLQHTVDTVSVVLEIPMYFRGTYLIGARVQ
jgi:hypothetical protein